MIASPVHTGLVLQQHADKDAAKFSDVLSIDGQLSQIWNAEMHKVK